ncbi:MAG: DNA internalization-related competence protein ComEC/Rec2 [Aquisalimonadaceae bacterium]
MPYVLLCFSGGVIVVHQLSVLPAQWLVTVVLLCLAPALRWPRWRAPWAFLAGAAFAVHTAHGALNDRLPDHRTGESLTVVGRIVSIPSLTGSGARFVFHPEDANAANLPGALQVSWYGAPAGLAAGATWQLRLRLRSPRDRVNPGVADQERYFLLGRVGALASVVPHHANRQLRPGGGLHYQRQQLAATIQRHVQNADAAALAVALSVGDRQHISTELRQRLMATGTSHLVAISGLHVGLVAGGVWWLTSLLWRISGLSGGRIPAPLAGVGPALAAAALYAALAGFALPTRRALVMAVLAFTALLARRRASPWTILLVAFAGVLALDPLAPLGAGLWLSFGAVAVLLWVLRGRGPGKSSIGQFIWLQLLLLVALAPLTLWWFGQIAWLAPVANLFAIPLVGSLAVPVLLTGLAASIGSDAAGGFLLSWSGWMLEWLNDGLRLLVAIGPDVATMLVPPAPLMMLAIAGAVLLLLPRGVPGRIGGACLLLLTVLWQPSPPPSGRADVVLMDTGHGHSLLIRTHEHALLFDTGSRYFSRDLHAVLRQQGVSRLDRLVLSDSRAGSIGGADLLTLPVADRVGVGQPRTCAQVQDWVWDGVRFRFLDARIRGAGRCLLLIESGDDRLLVAHALTPGSRRALETGGVDEAVSWVIVPHHGNRKASSEVLARTLAPRTAFVSVDRNNRYGLPHADTVAWWEQAGSTVVTIGNTGAVSIRLGLGRYSAERQRGRYWQR